MTAWLWLALGLSAALGDSGADLVTKRYFSHLPAFTMGWLRFLGAAPFLVLAGLWLHLPALGGSFWFIVAAMLPLEILALILYMRALQVCHLSLCIPFLAFTPVLLIFTGWLFLGEQLGGAGIAGTLTIAAGSYLLGLGAGNGGTGLLAPFKALAREQGARLMLVVAALYSCTAALYKLAVLNSEALFFGVVYPLICTGVITGGLPWNGAALRPTFKCHFYRWLIVGFCFALSALSFAGGVEMVPAAYMVAVKRLSLLFSVVLGGLWLQERPILPRIVGVVLMCSGVAVIALAG